MSQDSNPVPQYRFAVTVTQMQRDVTCVLLTSPIQVPVAMHWYCELVVRNSVPRLRRFVSSLLAFAVRVVSERGILCVESKTRSCPNSRERRPKMNICLRAGLLVPEKLLRRRIELELGDIPCRINRSMNVWGRVGETANRFLTSSSKDDRCRRAESG